jgi:hypothetical protein
MSVIIGVALSATCGFRVFVPFLGMAIACKAGHLTLSPGFEWIASYPAIVAFAVAAVFEIATYYIPWLDNIMDSITTPAAIVAGTIITASVIGDVSPLLQWSLAIIAGGGVAGTIQASSVILRGTSTVTTGGIANPIVSTFELIASIVGTILALVLPIIAISLILLFIIYLFFKYMKLKASKQNENVSL